MLSLDGTVIISKSYRLSVDAWSAQFNVLNMTAQEHVALFDRYLSVKRTAGLFMPCIYAAVNKITALVKKKDNYWLIFLLFLE